MLDGMSPAWQGFLIILGAGILILAAAALADRRTRRRSEGLLEKQASEHNASTGQASTGQATPTYTTMTELLRRSGPAPSGGPDEAALRDAPSLALALASPALDNDSHRSLATDPRVLVCGDPVTTVRELVPIWGLLPPGQAVTIAAPAFDAAVIDAAVANTRAGIRLVQAITGEAAARAELARLTGATTVERTDLQAGGVPLTALGHAKLIAASATASLVSA